MIRNSQITDPTLGEIAVKRDSRAKHLILRSNGETVAVTAPPGTPDSIIRDFIGKHRNRLEELARQRCPQRITPDYKVRTELFQLSFEAGAGTRFLARSEPGRFAIVYPPDADFADENLQQWLRKAIEQGMKRNAEILLPPRLKALADRHGLPYAQVRVTASKGRWGSCSARGDINLSLYLVLLPLPLIDYVLLHELAHTCEMNHGPRFWKLLDTLTGGRAHSLRDELREHRCAF